MSTVIPLNTPAGMPIPVEDENPLLSGRGPAAWAMRADVPDHTVHGEPKIRPMRAVPGSWVNERDPDPRGWPVLGADGVVAGTVTEIWMDTAEPQVRYYEVETTGGRRVLLPHGFSKVRARHRRIDVRAIYAAQFADVPTTRDADTVTLREEDQIVAYFAGGILWADASRAEPLL